ncbi:MAG: hypothetical protein Kow0075_06520 [Salibacteraceae bacterium]
MFANKTYVRGWMLNFLAVGILVATSQSIGRAQVKVEHRLVTDKWEANPVEFREDFGASVHHIEAPYPGGLGAKNEIAALKKLAEQKYPRRETPPALPSRGNTDTLSVLQSFPVSFFLNGNIMTGGTPNDNTLAISNDDMLLTSYNTQVWGYDLKADTFLFSYSARHPSFNQFISYYGDTTTSLYFPFDPKLMYDPVRDRFILVFLTGRNPSNSAAIVCFSSTNYPTDLWHVYRLSGNPLDDNTWTDYPQIAINENSLYLTLNQLYPDSSWINGFSQTVLWQIDLDAGFAGADSLPVKLLYNFEHQGRKIRYLHPVKSAPMPQSDTMYLIGNRPFDLENDTFFIVSVSGKVDETAQVDVRVATSDIPYGLPPDAQQPMGHTLQTNDARCLGAVRVGSEIQFVGNTMVHSTGRAGIFYGVIEDIASSQVQGKIITHHELDLGYPNIDFIGLSKNDREMVIFFDHTSDEFPAGNSAVYVNNEREPGEIQILAEGTTYIDRISGPTERWGDYIGLQRKYNAESRAWAAGYISFGSKMNGTWISEIAGPRDRPVGAEQPDIKNEFRVFPNPTDGYINVEFYMPQTASANIEILDANGRRVKILGKDVLKKGNNLLRFTTYPLSTGVYFIRITSDESVLLNKQIIVTKP